MPSFQRVLFLHIILNLFVIIDCGLLIDDRNVWREHNLGVGDDETISVKIKKPFKFWDKDITQFQVC